MFFLSPSLYLLCYPQSTPRFLGLTLWSTQSLPMATHHEKN